MKNIFLLCSVASKASPSQINDDLESLKGDMQFDVQDDDRSQKDMESSQDDLRSQDDSRSQVNSDLEFNMQIIDDLKKYIARDGRDSHTGTIDDFQQTLKNCKFFMFRHHRSAADRFERIIKSDENAYLLETISRIENNKNMKKHMNKVIDNYQDKVEHCEPILLSNVISVKKYYNHFNQYYNNITDEDRKRRVDETIYLRMRNFERAFNKGKRLAKSVKKNYEDKFVWETSLSPKYAQSDEEKIVKYIKKEFGGVSGVPKLLPPFNTILEKYSASLEHTSYSKAQQLVDYFFNGKELGVLDWAEWPADPKQADQMKRWLLRGQDVPILYRDNKKVQALCEEIAVILRDEQIDDIPNSWFATEVVGVKGREEERSTNSNQVRDEKNELFRDMIQDWVREEGSLLKDEGKFSSAKTYMISMFFGLVI